MRKRISLNQTTVNPLRKGLGFGQDRKTNGLAALAGKWTDEELADFEEVVREVGEQLDEDLGR